MTFPLVSVEDMVCAQFLLMDRLGIGTVHAVVGSSLGGMQSLMSAAIHPTRVGRYLTQKLEEIRCVCVCVLCVCAWAASLTPPHCCRSEELKYDQEVREELSHLEAALASVKHDYEILRVEFEKTGCVTVCMQEERESVGESSEEELERRLAEHFPPSKGLHVTRSPTLAKQQCISSAHFPDRTSL